MPKDVFLCHNSKEKAEVEKIRAQLLQKGIDAWLDKYDFEPFRRWQDQLEEIIPQVKAVAVFIGSSGVGPWADIEMREFLVEFAKNHKLRIGLVILPGCPDKLINTVPRFLKGFHWVDFRLQNPDPMEQLIWGITGQRPTTQPGTGTPPKPSRIPKRQFLKWVGLGTVGLVIPVVSLAILSESDAPTGKKPEPSQTPEVIVETPPVNANDELTKPEPSQAPTPKPVNANDESIPLESEKGIDYTKLRNFLAARNWQEADKETGWVMSKAINGGWSSEAFLNFPCTDLRTIDQLWVKYSNGHFGFSVQNEIYLSVGGKAGGYHNRIASSEFADRVGWWKNLNFDDTTFPKGHFPSFFLWGISSLASRLVNCNI